MAQAFRLGTRGSALARAQAEAVRTALVAAHPGLAVELVIVQTTGDRAPDVPLTQLGGEGVFVAELRDALRRGAVDCAVHSLKDLPTAAVPGLRLAAVCLRADPRDVAVTRGGVPLAGLATGATVGTGSPRRQAQLHAAFPALRAVPMRGNVPTRLSRVTDGTCAAVIVAGAGLARLGRLDAVTEWLAPEVMLPAPGQGAVAIEVLDGGDAARLAAVLHDAATATCVTAERALLATVGGGCLVPLGALAELAADGTLRLRGVLADGDGTRLRRAEARGPASAAAELVRRVANALQATG